MTDTSLVVEAKLEKLPAIRSFIREAMADAGLPPASVDDMELAVDELVTNIMRHGYRGRPGKIEIEVNRKPESVEICLRDQAPLFDPTLLPGADVTTPLEQRPVGGLGVHLARQLVDTFTHRRTSEGGNELTLTKKTDDSAQEISHASND